LAHSWQCTAPTVDRYSIPAQQVWQFSNITILATYWTNKDA